MKLKGSCHCGAVHFECESGKHPHPYQLCYCNICRKTAGGGGYAIFVAGDLSTLSVNGEDFLSTYCAKIEDPQDRNLRPQSRQVQPCIIVKSGVAPCHCQVNTLQRKFCNRCGSYLWLYDPTWPELVQPFASAIDSELPVPPEKTHLMLEFKPSWVQLNLGPNDLKFDGFPEESIAQ